MPARSIVLVSLVATAVAIGAAGPLLVPAKGSPIRVLGAAGKGTWRLAIGDVDADGAPDVASSNLESDSLSVFLGQR